MNEGYHVYAGYTRYVDFKRLDFIVRTVRSYFNNRTKLRGLDVGCGKGDIAVPLAFLGYIVVGIDICSEHVEEAKRWAEAKKAAEGNPTFLIGDAENLPFKVSSFDFAICSEVLEHLKRPERALKRINKALKEGGLLIVTVPNGYGSFSLIYDHFRNKIASKVLPRIGSSDHIQFFTLSKITGLIKEAGFEVLDIKHSDFVSFLPVLVKSKRFCYYDCKLADKLPSLLVSGWYISCRRI
jgi:ubiquinone biosynthesis O-methyltransferase